MRRLGRPELLLLLVLVITGCERQEPIVSYTVPKHDAIQIPIETEASKPMEDPTHRMLAATVLVGDVAWYFKGTALIDQFPSDAGERFDMLLASLRFEAEAKPSWELGESWKELPGSGMRVANLMLGNVEFSVTKLPIRSDIAERQYVLDNINRWRRQLQLRPLSSAQLAQQSHKIETSDGRDATVIDYQGKQDASAMPPMARAGSGAPLATGGSEAPASAGFQYVAPEHWKQQKVGMMQLAVFEAGDGEGSATISVSKLGGAAGGVLANVNRWRGQVGLPPVADEKEAEAESIQVSDSDSLLLEFRGEEGKSMSVAMVPHQDSVWFFKMLGDTAVVEKEGGAFRDFLASIRLN